MRALARRFQQDEELWKGYAEGSAIADLAKAFGRNRGAIKARLGKLGLIED